MGIIGILVDCLIFCFMFVLLNRGIKFWICLISYVVAFILKAILLYGVITFQATIVYCIIGAVIIWLLEKLVDAINPLVFMIMAILIQEGVTLLIGLTGIFR